MEESLEHKSSPMRFALPALGAAAAVMLIRRMTGGGSDLSKEQMLLEESSIDLQEALRIALKYMPGTPVEIELEESHGMPVWEVEIVPKKGGPTREVLIDARNGDVLEMKAEYEDAA